MNLLILMAGGSDAFSEAGYTYPKNLVEIDGQPLVQRVIENLSCLCESGDVRAIFMVPEAENRQYHTGEVIRLLMPDAIVLEVPHPTAGAACTALLATESLLPDAPLLIVNGDQMVATDLQAMRTHFEREKLDGGILVFEAVHPRWSYVRCDADGKVTEAAEKRPISNHATAGVYYFARASDFQQAAMQMIRKDAHVGGHFYICPAYNEMILKQAQIGVWDMPREEYYSLATPQGVQDYEALLRSRRALSSAPASAAVA